MGFKQKGEELYEKFYDIVRRYSAQQRRIKEFKKKCNKNVLTKEQISEIDDFYKPYYVPNKIFHNFFTEKTGDFSAYYMPQDVYVGFVDPYFNDIRAAKYLDNKCYYDLLFHWVPQPKVVLKRINNIWLSGEGTAVSKAQMKQIIDAEKKGMFVKEAQITAGGDGVTYVESGAKAFEKVVKAALAIKTDIIVQGELTQHADIAKLNSSSVNTLRMYSLLGKDGNVKIYSSVLRIGVGGAKIDNYSSGGVSCGISEDGKLKKYAYNKKGERVEKHPTSGIVFEGYSVPSFEKAVELIHKAHPTIPHFRSIAWDIAIEADGTAVLIEANLCRGGTTSLQLCNGPVYGEDTKAILDEVFGKHR